MQYSAWGKGGVADTFIAGCELPETLRAADGLLHCLKVFEAPTWEDAMRQYHEWQGWEPYQPMPDTE